MSINLESVPTAVYVLDIPVFTADTIFSCRPKAVAAKSMSLPLKVLIGSLITVGVVGAIVGPSVYFGLAGNGKSSLSI